MLRRLLLALALACAALPAAAVAKPKKKPAPVAKPAPMPKAPRDALLAAADEIVRQVAALRGLPPKSPIERGVLSRDEIGAKLKERIAKEYTPDEVRAEARVLKRMGLLPQDADYEKLILDLLMEQVAGFYDPFTARLYIADWLPLELQRPALAHEIEHGLQDQYFDLKKFAQPLKDDGDRQLARSALVEGDGTAVMLEFQAQAMGLPADQLPELVATIGKQMASGGMGGTPLFDQAPAFLKQTLIFPYLAGLTFVEALKRQQPWSRIDEVWKSPPESTEQVLHPEKYTAKEKPIAIVAAAPPSLGARKELRRDVLGELELRILFASKLDEAAAEKAAAGWGGDRLAAYADPAAPESAPTVIDLSVWDSETDAKEAEAAARALIGKLAEGSSDEWFAERKGDKLLMVLGAPAGSRAALSSDVWKGWKVMK